MRLFLHIGCHKTGTTAFQTFCRRNQDRLTGHGVHYPRHDRRPNQNYVMWDFQRHGLAGLRAFLAEQIATARPDCDAVLMSGEDFENCLVEPALAGQIAAAAKDVGFDSIDWIVVTRPSEAYIASLYAEMSKHRVVLSLTAMRRAAQKHGAVTVAGNNYTYRFALTPEAYLDAFRKQAGGPCHVFDMDTFFDCQMGGAALRLVMGDARFDAFMADVDTDGLRRNTRLGAMQVELNYARTFLGLEPAKSPQAKHWLQVPFLAPMAAWRLWYQRHAPKRRKKKAKR